MCIVTSLTCLSPRVPPGAQLWQTWAITDTSPLPPRGPGADYCPCWASVSHLTTIHLVSAQPSTIPKGPTSPSIGEYQRKIVIGRAETWRASDAQGLGLLESLDASVGRKEESKHALAFGSGDQERNVGQSCRPPTLSAPPFFLVARLVTQFAEPSAK